MVNLLFTFFSQSIKKCKYCKFSLGCFVCGMNDGIRIFNTEPLVEKLYLSIYKFWKKDFKFESKILTLKKIKMRIKLEVFQYVKC